MKYKLIIDKSAEEEIIAKVHAPSSLTQQIEDLVCSYSGIDSIMAYREDEMRKLAFQEIECITIMERKVIAILIHGGVLYIAYLVTYLLNDWLEQGVTPILAFSGIFIVCYLLIWIVIYSVTKRDTEKVNEILKKKQQGSDGV